MQIAPRLELHLQAMGIPSEPKHQQRTATASETAEAAHVPGRQLAKAVLLEDGAGPLLAVLARTEHVELQLLNQALGRRRDLASEPDAAHIVVDCAVGALPAAGTVYGLEVVVDAAFGHVGDVYLEAGDHGHVLRLRATDFARPMRLARRVDFAVHGASPEPAAQVHGSAAA